MRVSQLDDETRQAMLLRVRDDPACRPALARLQGEVLLVRITGGPEYRLVFSADSVTLDPEATPTITAEASDEVFDRILAGELDPLTAILTRRLKATIDPVRGPLLRQILRSGIGRPESDMGWTRVIGKL